MARESASAEEEDEEEEEEEDAPKAGPKLSSLLGESACAKLTVDGGVECIKEPRGRVFAASAPVAGSALWTLRCRRNANQNSPLFIGLVASDKDLTGGGYIARDQDVWLLHTGFGSLWSGGGGRSNSGGKILPGDVVELKYDAAAATLSFLRGGEVVGRHTGVASNPKLVIQMIATTSENPMCAANCSPRCPSPPMPTTPTFMPGRPWRLSGENVVIPAHMSGPSSSDASAAGALKTQSVG
jgi:hypothetical protein